MSGEAAPAPSEYAHLVDPNVPQKFDITVEDAAVRSQRVLDEAPTPEQAAAIDSALRERHPRPPLTEADISKLTASRGMAPTQAEIDGMNQSRALGIHTSII